MKICFLISFQILAVSLFAQGIAFSDGSWDDLLARAKDQNKIIFVDAYTTWCGPCKMMDAKVFSDASVGQYYNANFINAKIDMEKGEGPQLARRYGVQAYPSFLFVGGDGEIVHRGLGYQPTESFIELGKAALSGGLQQWASRYDRGDRDPAFLNEYANTLVMMEDERATEVTEAYLATQDDWKQPENMNLIISAMNGTDSKLFRYVVEHRKDFMELMGNPYVVYRIQEVINQEIIAEQGNDTAPTPERVEAIYQRAVPDLAPMLSTNFRMNYYRAAGDQAKYQEAAAEFADKYAEDDAMQLNNLAWEFYENVDDPKMLKKATRWAKRSVKMEPQYYNMDTLAALYYKTGKKSRALKTAQAAIDLGNANGDDVSGTAELLAMIKQM